MRALVLDPRRRELREGGEVLVSFGRSRLGYRLFEAIALDPGLAREELYERVWEMPHRAPHADNAFHVALNALRKRLGELKIERVGQGYGVAGAGVRLLEAAAPAPARPPRPAAVARWSSSGSLALLHEFVGRQAEAEELSALLDRGRIAAVVGPGGIGKTRLVGELLAVRESARKTDLSTVKDASGLVDHLAALLQAETVGAGLARLGPCTVLLDDLVAADCEALLVGWLSEAPELRLVVTSRRRLELPSIELGPLPDGAAVELLRGRLGRDDPDLTELARRLGGVPLLLELATAPARLLGARKLLERMGPDVLSRSGGLARHRDPAASLSWSLEQLEPAEGQALRDCAVFAGAFSLEAAEVVLGADLGILDRLVEHHLLRLDEGRLCLWPLVREVLGPPREELRRAHLAWMCAAANRHAAQTRRPGGLAALDWLEGELPNLVEAFEYALAVDPDRAVQLAWAVDPLLERRGFATTRQRLADGLAGVDDWRARIFEGRTWRWRGELDRAEAAFAAVGLEAPLARGHARLGLAGVAVMRHGDAVPLYQGALEAFEEAGDQAMARRTRALLAPFAEDLGALRDVLAEHRASSDLRGAAIALGKLAGEQLDLGRAAQAMASATEARRLSATLGDGTSWAVQGGLVAFAHHLAGELEQADALYRECIDALEGTGRTRSRLILELNRGLVGLESGAEVREVFHAVRHGASSQGASALAAAAELGLALVELREGSETRARRWLGRVREVTTKDRLLALVDLHLAGGHLPAPRSAEERVVGRFLRARGSG